MTSILNFSTCFKFNCELKGRSAKYVTCMNSWQEASQNAHAAGNPRTHQEPTYHTANSLLCLSLPQALRVRCRTKDLVSARLAEMRFFGSIVKSARKSDKRPVSLSAYMCECVRVVAGKGIRPYTAH